MNCPKCGGDLILVDNTYICRICGAKFVSKSAPTNSNFHIVGGVLYKYLGSSPDVVIPEGVVEIAPQAFKDNRLIRSVTFSSIVRTIGKNAFENCSNLASISNYRSVVCYQDECFRYAGLTSINIYPDVHTLGKYCFANMPYLESVYYNPELDLKLTGTFLHCPNLKDIEMEGNRFFPSMKTSVALYNNNQKGRPTWGDAFPGTPFIKKMLNKYMEAYNKGICYECGGHLRKSLFHAKCEKCGVDYKN